MRMLRPTKVRGLRLNIVSLQEHSQSLRYEQTQYKFRIELCHRFIVYTQHIIQLLALNASW